MCVSECLNTDLSKISEKDNKREIWSKTKCINDVNGHYEHTADCGTDAPPSTLAHVQIQHITKVLVTMN